SRYRRQDEARENQVHEWNDVLQEERDAFAAQRQELDVEDVHNDQYCQQDELRPLRGVAEEETHLLEHQLAPHHAPRRENARYELAERALSYPALTALLGFAETAGVQPAVQQRAEHDR